MKYTYAYKSSDGTRHEAAMEAASREAVFAALRAKGIKAIKVVAKDGSKANGEMRGVRKRTVVAAVVGVAVVTAILTIVIRSTPTPSTYTSGDEVAPRHQIYGDPALVERFERGDFAGVFTNKADRMLAWFAQPGKLMCPKGTDPRRCADAFASFWHGVSPRQLGDCDGRDAHRPSDRDGRDAHRPSDSREVRELKQIVNGMRQELRDYLANGNGTPKSYWRRLLERTQEEMRIYERTRRELENEKSEAVWEQKNEALRKIGLRTIPNPAKGSG